MTKDELRREFERNGKFLARFPTGAGRGYVVIRNDGVIWQSLYPIAEKYNPQVVKIELHNPEGATGGIGEGWYEKDGERVGPELVNIDYVYDTYEQALEFANCCLFMGKPDEIRALGVITETHVSKKS